MSPAPSDGKVAVITGASAGIGAAAARSLARVGFSVVLGARRAERLATLAEAIEVQVGAGGPRTRARALDVTSAESVTAFLAEEPRVDLLVNNAGLASGMEPVAEASVDDWRYMYEVNVLGVLRLTRACLPALLASGDGHVVNIGSIASFETYPGGAGYTASKHALRAVTRTLRKELLGKPVRVTEICPGMVETEFSEVRFRGDKERAAAVYQGMEPLTAADIADCITWAATRPARVNIDEIVVRPRDQAAATMVHRRSPEETP